jgi:hypothetical protein
MTAFTANERAHKAEIATQTVPCCGYPAPADNYPVYWNPFNGVVQCHNCGQVWSPQAKSSGSGVGDTSELVRRLQLTVANLELANSEGRKQSDRQNAEIVRLLRVEHLAWHLCESSEERCTEGIIVVDKDDFYALSKALPEEHPQQPTEAADAIERMAGGEGK